MLLNQNLFLALLAIIFFWLVTFSFLLWRTISHYQKLTAGVKKKQLGEVLEKILKTLSSEGEKVDALAKRLAKLEKEGNLHVQKVGLVRFNPFSDTGGNQSFVLALLDGQDNGLVFSTLHSRDQTRIYAKPIKGGKGRGFDLSKEEQEAIQKAKRGGVR